MLPKNSTDTKWWKSWTVWANGIGIGLEAAQVVLGYNILPPGITIIALPIVNLGLRIFKTKGRLVK